MKSTKRVNIEDKSGYYFMNMTNIKNFDADLLVINELATFSSGLTMFEISYGEESNTRYIVFNDIQCVFRKRGQDKYLIICEENEEVFRKYKEIIDEIKD